MPSPVFGSLLVVSHVGHVPVDLVGGAQDVVDDLTEIAVEVCCGHRLQLGLRENKMTNIFNFFVLLVFEVHLNILPFSNISKFSPLDKNISH